MTTATKPAFVLAPNQGKRLNILGHTATVKVSSQDAAGHYYTIAVLEGEFENWLDGKTHPASPGSVFHFPRLIPHGFTNVGSTTGRTLWTVIPGGNFEAFFEELNMLPSGPPDMAKVAAIFAKYHIDILPPPA